jgi:hypothetical protein
MPPAPQRTCVRGRPIVLPSRRGPDWSLWPSRAGPKVRRRRLESTRREGLRRGSKFPVLPRSRWCVSRGAIVPAICLLFLFLGHLEGGDEFEHVGVTAGESLSDDLEGAGHDVGAFDGNGNGEGHVGVTEVVLVAADGRPGRDVHGAFDNAASTTTTTMVLIYDWDNGIMPINREENDIVGPPRSTHI